MTNAISDILAAFARTTGIIFPEHRQVDATRLVRRAMTAAHVGEHDLPAKAVTRGTKLYEQLIEQLTVRETYFFRDYAQFETIQNKLLPQWRESHSSDMHINAWSAGCASGEEAYSLAMLFEQEKIPARVVGTDISRQAIAEATQGTYDHWSLRGEGRRALAFCDADDAPFTIPDRLRARVQFHHLNLADDHYPSQKSGIADMDIVMCRNVLMYFDEPTIRRIADRLRRSLAPNGWLITGPSDPPLWDYLDLEPVITMAGVLYRNEPRSISRPLVPPAQTLAPRAKAPPKLRRRQPNSIVRDSAAAPHDNDNLPDFVRIRAAADRGDLSQAIDAADSALAQNPASAEMHFVRTVALVAAGRDGEALDALRRVLYLDNSLAVAHYVNATLLERKGDIDSAGRAYARTQALCEALPPDDVLPLTDGETAGQLMTAARDSLGRLNRRKAAHG